MITSTFMLPPRSKGDDDDGDDNVVATSYGLSAIGWSVYDPIGRPSKRARIECLCHEAKDDDPPAVIGGGFTVPVRQRCPDVGRGGRISSSAGRRVNADRDHASLAGSMQRRSPAALDDRSAKWMRLGTSMDSQHNSSSTSLLSSDRIMGHPGTSSSMVPGSATLQGLAFMNTSLPHQPE